MKSIGADDEIEISDAAVLEAYLQTRFRLLDAIRPFAALEQPPQWWVRIRDAKPVGESCSSNART